MAEVTFDGPNKLIIVDSGITELDALVALYSDWKEWATTSDNTKYLQAFRTVGGDPTVGAQSVSPYFFLMNGWLIRPYEADHELYISGNLYGEAGAALFAPTLGAYTVLVTIDRSEASLTTAVGGGVTDWTTSEKTQIRDALGVNGSKVTAAGGQLQDVDTLLQSVDGQVQVIDSAVGDVDSAVGAVKVDTEELLARLTLSRAAALDLISGVDSSTTLLRKIAINRLELADGDGDNWVLYDDDNVTPLLLWPVRDKDNAAIAQIAGVPSRRGIAVSP